MTIHQSPDGLSQGSPNLEYLQYLQKNWTPAEIGAMEFISKAEVVPSGGNIEFTIPVGATILDAHVICTAASSGGTVQIKTGADSPVAISDAMICAVDKVLVRAASIDDAYNVVGADGIIAVPGQDGDSGDVYIRYKK